MKALRFIDRKKQDGIEKKQILRFLNSNIDQSNMQLSDMTNVYRRLGLKQGGRINYIDFYNQVYRRRSITGYDDEFER